MDKKHEKILIGLMILSLISLPFLHNKPTASAADGEGFISSSGLINQHPGIMRLHVVANSDSKDDQSLKLAVRDYVLTKVQDEITRELSEHQGEEEEVVIMRNYIKNNLSQIEAWAQEILDSWGVDYGVSASVGVRYIPAKHYDDIFFPEGNYEALTISLGAGLGKNWWCVVFPPLCLVDSENSSYNDEFGITEEDRLILKFKTAEILKGDSENATSQSENYIFSSDEFFKGIISYRHGSN